MILSLPRLTQQQVRKRPRSQRTIASAVEVAGIGFLTGADVRLTLHPAPAGHGVAFQRADLHAPAIPARIEFTIPRQRRTALSDGRTTFEMVEHVMAALAGLQVDNCLVTLNACEPPGMDGSCRDFAEAILSAGIVDQGAPREFLLVHEPASIASDDGRQSMAALPDDSADLTIDYSLDYGAGSPIPKQRYRMAVTPTVFLEEIAFARTFVLEAEAQALRAQGYGQRLTEKDLLIFGPDGPIGNPLRAPDECARHKLLDCIGDLALLGADIRGRVVCHRTGHQQNADLVRLLQSLSMNQANPSARRAA